MLDTLNAYFAYPFVRYALIVGVLIAFCSALLGVTLVLRRYSFVGDSLSHVAFGAMSVAMVMKLTNNMLLSLPVTIVCAILLLRSNRKTKAPSDAILAVISVSSLAAGYLIINLFSKSANISADVCSTLFGSTSILTLKASDVCLCLVIALVVLFIFIFFYRQIFAITFDEPFSKASGVNTELYNTLLAIVTAMTIVLAMNLVGSLLISALIIFPALSAMCLYKSFKSVMIFSVIFSIICAAAGIIISILFGTPVGSTIVAIDFAGYLLSILAGKILGRG